MRFLTWAVLAGGVVFAAAAADLPSAEKIPSTRDYQDIRSTVETLRGKQFRRTVPVYRISEAQLRAIADRELDKQFPGAELRHYEELLAWLDVVPPHTSLKSAYADFLVDQVAGLYDSDTKEMCIPGYSSGATNVAQRAAAKQLEKYSTELGDIVLAHEFTHALEDQYWPLDDPADTDPRWSTDRDTAHSFLAEGSATRAMLEAIPAQWERELPGSYFPLWNLMHSGPGESVLRYALAGAWKSQDALVAGVPESLARTEAMPYSFGYSFCTRVMRQWGLDGLDYIYEHPPVSSEQVMHPSKGWEWRDFPVQIDLPETLPGGWTRTSVDSLGEAGIAAWLGCQFRNLNRGLEIGRGWDGDHVALFEHPAGHRLLVWASSWDSTNAAARFAGAWLKERQMAHQAEVSTRDGHRREWSSPDGRAGIILRTGERVILFETDARGALQNAEAWTGTIAFTPPPEDAARASVNRGIRRFNPLWSWQKDGDYTITRTVCGLLSRHDQNSVGAADTFLLGMLGESRRTASFHKWQLGGGWVAWHESEKRRGLRRTTVLPWGVLASFASARLPQDPHKTISRATVLWGIGASVELDGKGRRSVRALPFGLLLDRTTEPERYSFHILATGITRREKPDHSGSATRFRLLGIPVWTAHGAAPRQ